MCPIYQQGKWEAVELVLDQGKKTLSGWIMGFHQADFSLFSNFSLVVRIVYLYNRPISDQEDKGNIENKKKHDQLDSPIPLVGHHDLVDQDDGVGE